MQQIMSAPLWDEGISLFLCGEYDKRNEPFSLEDLRGFANENAIRIGDILETLFLMTIYGEWKFTTMEGAEKELDEDALNELYAKGRLSEEDLVGFEGLWQPV